MLDEPSSPGSTSSQEAVNAATYKEMRMALHSFETSSEQAPRAKAFYSALRTVLTECVEEQDQKARGTRLAAAHQWFVKHRPRQKPANPAMAAAMAASLSVQQPAAPAQQHQQQPQGTSRRQACNPATAYRSSTSHGGMRFDDGADDVAAPQPDTTVCLPSSSRSGRSSQHVPAQLHSSSSQQSGISRTGTTAISSTTSRPAWSTAVRVHPSEQQTAMFGRQPAICDVSTHSSNSSTGVHKAECSSGDAGLPAAHAASGLAPSQQVPASAPAAATASVRRTGSSAATDLCRSSLPTSTAGAPSTSKRSSQGSSAAAGPSASEQAAWWRQAAVQEEAFERAVKAELQAHAQHRARLEQEIMRRQEALRLSHPATAAAGAVGRQAGAQSQGRPLSACSGRHQTLLQQLAHADPIKATRQKLLAESATECSHVAAQLQSLGIDMVPGAVAHALLPAPEQPFLTCLAKLPKPGALLCSAGAQRKRRHRAKRHSAGGSN